MRLQVEIQLPQRPSFRNLTRMAKTHERLLKAYRYILPRFTDDFDLARASSCAGLERVYFSRAFKKWMGIGFPEWLNELRISYARDLLLSTRLSISEIAFSVGYHDISTFERRFKTSERLAPREYRELHRPRRRLVTSLLEISGGY